MNYNPTIHHRKSIRLKGYDYSQAGLYFITICCQNRAHLFGHIENGKMVLNDAGKMVEYWYYRLESKFTDIKCREMVVMPNHFHCVIENVGIMDIDNVNDIVNDRVDGRTTVGADVGADPRVRPNNVHPNDRGRDINHGNVEGEHVGSPLHAVIQWFKTMTTNYYIRGVKQNGWTPFDKKMWQRNYWEHIVRNENAYQRIAQYIINNPKQWEIDRLK